MAKEFSVLDMAEEYAAENDIDAEDLFKKPPVIETETEEYCSEDDVWTAEVPVEEKKSDGVRTHLF